MKLLILLTIFTISYAQDSLICVDRIGLVNTLVESDSLQYELDQQAKLITLFENDTTQAKSLIRTQKTYIQTLKEQRLQYKRYWINAEREHRNSIRLIKWGTFGLSLVALIGALL